MKVAAVVSKDHPVVLSKFVENAKELEIDGVAQNGEIAVSAISEHIENAGVHSGDATIVLPPQRIYLETIRRVRSISALIVKALKISGPFNIQFLAKDNQIQVIECNLRASRSFPFVSKVTRAPLIQIAAESILNIHKPKSYETLDLNYVGVKTPQFSYNRLKGADPVATVEMASTGEVAHIGDSYLEAFFASWLSTEQKLKGKRLLVTACQSYKGKLLGALKALDAKGWDLFATEGTHAFLASKGIGSVSVYKVGEKYEPNITTLMAKQAIDLIINLPEPQNNDPSGYQIRRLAIEHHIPLITNPQLAAIFLQCLVDLNPQELPIRSWEEFCRS